MRVAFLGSLVTVGQRQFLWSSVMRISCSIACLIVPGCASFLSLSSILDVSTVQYGVSVIVDGEGSVEWGDVRLLGWLLGGVRAISAYDGVALGAV